MAEDADKKRARDLARYHARKQAGTYRRSTPQTPEQLARKQARDQRRMQWREVDRAFTRLLRLEPEVFAEAKQRVDASHGW